MEELAKKTVSYFSDDDISIHCLCGQPMRPLRVKLTNKLVEAYGLDRKMKMHRPRELTYEELNTFHADGAPHHCRVGATAPVAASSDSSPAAMRPRCLSRLRHTCMRWL